MGGCSDDMGGCSDDMGGALTTWGGALTTNPTIHCLVHFNSNVITTICHDLNHSHAHVHVYDFLFMLGDACLPICTSKDRVHESVFGYIVGATGSCRC